MFIQVIQARCSRADELREFGRGWATELGPGATGWLGSTHGVTDDGEFLGIVRFASRAAAEANSARPEQGAWAEKLATYMDGPISFTDHDDVTEFRDGGSDSSGFVQVIRGRVDDAGRLRKLIDDFGTADEMRPDVIGGTLAIGADGAFTETVYFTDEAAARAGEQDEPPADVLAELGWAMDGAAFFDLRDPWFESA